MQLINLPKDITIHLSALKQNDNLTVTKTRIPTILRHDNGTRYEKQLTSPGV